MRRLIASSKPNACVGKAARALIAASHPGKVEYPLGMKRKFFASIGLVVSLPSLLLANAGFPILAAQAPLTLAGLIPVVLLETFVISRKLARPFKENIFPVLWANLFSTLVGIPYYFLLWLPPGENDPRELIKMNIILIFAMIPAFFISVYAERFVLRKILKAADYHQLNDAVWTANLYSYVLLMGWCFLRFLLSKPSIGSEFVTRL